MVELTSIQPDLVRVAPNLTLGVLIYETRVAKGDEALSARISEEAEKIRTEIEPGMLTARPQISALREVYRSLGRDPGRYRGSAEALLRRALSGKDLYEVNTVVDVNNLISLHTTASVGSYDLDRIQGRVGFGVGGPDHSYRAIGKGLFRLEGLPVFHDETGPFGSPTSDSERTMIRESTTRAMTVVISFAGDAEMGQSLRFAAEALGAHAAALSITTYMVDRTGVR